ncbi:MAG TPA: cytochrome P450 [Actinophytocola sp.]|uniref:cytochrome P450 n=1 Tax=Actinophytocola sp. TaxID=1872138 RepID=UPI002DDCCADE|nr:cytochrome P450 [Actinophytocola sp.]HEV2783292.1 cytochrome P450 [Actinophytocola sp.]
MTKNSAGTSTVDRRRETVARYPLPWSPPLEIPDALRDLRDRATVVVRLPGGDTALLVTRYADVRALFTDRRLSRNIARPDAARITEDNDAFADPRVDPDAPHHTRMRGLVDRVLTVSRVRALRPTVWRIADDLMDRMACGAKSADLNEAFAFPLPIRVMGALLGVPAADMPAFHRLVNGFLSITRPRPDQVADARRGLWQYLDELIASKWDSPSDDLTSALIAVSDEDGYRITGLELGYWIQGLLIAGYVTTASQIGTGTAMLLHHRHLVKEIQSDWSLLPTAVEELLRCQIMASSIGTLRYALADVALEDGTVLPRGSSVLLSQESANMDETVFADPFTIDLARPDNPHLTFGAGPHHCAGAELARMEIQVATEGLLRRFPDLRLAVPGGELPRGVGGFMESFTEIPVTW